MLTRRVRLIVGGLLVAIVGASIATYLWNRASRQSGNGGGAATSGTDGGPGTVEALPGFKALTDESGIQFRMQFLPGEQGENFKINLYDHGCGLAVGDYNGDGHDDIYFCNQLGANALYRNKGDGTFEDVTASAGPIGLDDRICVGATFSDYDNDGDQDLYVTSTRGGNALFQNNGRGEFRDVTEEAGLSFVGHSQTACFFDCDQDGDLDLLVINTAAWTTDDFNDALRYYAGPADIFTLTRSPKEFNVLYRNDGEGRFTDISEASGLKGRGWAGDVAVLDYDEDGRDDVLITNMFGMCQLYHNEGEGRFSDVTNQTLQRTSYGGVGAKAADFNNDGRLDLYVLDMHSDMWMSPALPAASINEKAKYPFGDTTRPGITAPGIEQEKSMIDQLGDDFPRLLFGNTFFKNQGGGKFEETSDPSGVETFWPWGAAAGDFDNDGDVDAFVPSGMGYPFAYWRNYLLMNRGDATFLDESRSRGIDPPPGGEVLPTPIGGRPATRSSRCAATADFDGDGRLDLVVNNFNDAPYFYRNEFPKQNYVQFRLRGTRSNRDAIGATVRLQIGDEVLLRQVEPAGGYLSQSSKTLHFGLGSRDKIDRAEIRWPSGLVETIEAPRINTLHELTEGSPAAAEAPSP